MIHQQKSESRRMRSLNSYLGCPGNRTFDLCLAFVASFTYWKRKQRYIYIHHRYPKLNMYPIFRNPQKIWRSQKNASPSPASAQLIHQAAEHIGRLSRDSRGMAWHRMDGTHVGSGISGWVFSGTKFNRHKLVKQAPNQFNLIFFHSHYKSH